MIVAILVMAGMAFWLPAAQAQALFGTTSPPVAGDSVFYRIDPTTGAATPIGPVRVLLASAGSRSSDDRGVVRRGL